MHAYGKWRDKKPKELAKTAVDGALKSAGLEWKDLQSAWCGHTSLGMTAGARLFAPLGRTGLSITNVENASATGSYAFRGAYLELANGEFDLALALGIDMLPRQAQAPKPEAPKDDGAKSEAPKDKDKPRPPTGPMLKFAQDARAHMDKHGTTLDQLAQVSVKQHFNAARNPYAQYQEEVTLEQVHAAREVAAPLTVLHCCPFGDGAAAAVLASERAVARLGIKNPIWVMVSGRPQVLLMHERMIDYINSHDGVGWLTFDAIADDFARRSPRMA
jgi:acetyl-CoA acetyltransferase